MGWCPLLAVFLLASLLTSVQCVASTESFAEENVSAYSFRGPLFGVTYSPFALNTDSMCLPTSQVEQDMEIIHAVADHVRLYNLAVCEQVTQTILNFCRNNGMRAIIGPYLSGNVAMNDAEVAAVQPLLREYGAIIDAVIVGNEVLFSKTLSLDDLLYYIRQVKKTVTGLGLQTPVTTADVWPVYESAIGPRLVEATDFLCMNMQPFWEGWEIVCPADIAYECVSAGRYVHAKADGLSQYFGKPVWICESGWPTDGERCCQGRPNARDGLLAGPSEANATIFIGELVAEGKRANRPTYVHAIFDEDWKRIWAPCGTCEGLSTQVADPSCNTCELDYHFGIYNFNRKPKPGVVLPQSVYVAV